MTAEPIPLRAVAKAKFVPGDTVVLRSGGLPMTVTGCSKGVACCSWHDEVGNPIDHEYPVEALDDYTGEEVEAEA